MERNQVLVTEANHVIMPPNARTSKTTRKLGCNNLYLPLTVVTDVRRFTPGCDSRHRLYIGDKEGKVVWRVPDSIIPGDSHAQESELIAAWN